MLLTHYQVAQAPLKSWTETRISVGSLASGPALVAYISAVEFALHLPNPGGYGFYIDELYFMACGEHLALGYVDLPPLTAFQAWAARELFGHSLLAVRIFPTLAAAGLVLLTGALVRQFGGGRFAQFLAALAVLVAPFYLVFCSYLSMNAIEPLLWTGCAMILIRMITTGQTKLWIWFGLLAGIGLENKHTMAVFGFALIAGLAMTAQRKLIANRWFLLGGLVAMLLFVPNFVWMVQNHFPHFAELANTKRNHHDVPLSLLGFVGWQILGMQPLTLPIWLTGLWFFTRSEQGKPYRALGWAYLLTLLLLFVGGRLMHGEIDHTGYYLAPAYPMLFGVGAVTMERWFARLQWSGWRWLYAGLVAATGVIAVLNSLPLLPPETYIRYTRFIGISQPKFEDRQAGELPQTLAERFGWPEMAVTVARVYNALPPAKRAQTAIFVRNYGEAGAIDFYGPELGLPKAISGHVNYWYWGPRGYTGESMIVVGAPLAPLERSFVHVEAKGDIGNRYAMASERFTIYLCSTLKSGTLAEAWPHLQNWDRTLEKGNWTFTNAPVDENGHD